MSVVNDGYYLTVDQLPRHNQKLVDYKTVNNDEYLDYQIKIPEKSGWRCELFGMGNSLIIHPTKVPNKFWRMMQYLIFGNRWKK